MYNTNNLHGALYPLHTHLNHSCRPNSKVVDTLGRLAEIIGNRFLAKLILVVSLEEGIAKDKEVTISYINPDWSVALRRDNLKRDYGFDCDCERCVEELENSEKVKEAEGGIKAPVELENVDEQKTDPAA